ncbi:hypothetical protein ONZ45_g18498 [Pleurotus djamor]|nr:hypothetical protein ONZ45_g18498 [Pleurotus djamor]
MAKAKASSSKSSKQKSIKSFFDTSASKKKKASKKEDEDENAGSPNDDAQESSDAEMEDVEKAKPGDAASSPKPPPISSIPLMFDDLVSRIPEIKDVANRIAGRPLRVATMCSGTESPLLALDMIRDSMKKLFNVDINVKHEFSCEIEPFKQAYIERNFQPPILFRDVCELGGDEAHTAYGALAPVPGDVDMLVAGTSCVDYSNLNNEKQDIDANGESGRTFRGMMSWVKKHRPPIVILENVCSAPWDKVKDYFRDNDYSAEFVRVDTKAYYIPHTRTRVYLFAVDQVKSKIPEEWLTWVKDKLKRPATATLDSLMLGTDEPRIHTARQKLVSESAHALDRRTGRTDWSRCESRHQRARLEEQLGDKRPLTSWDDGGYCKVAVDAWGDWATIQVERVWDLMDISLLRSAKLGIDPAYKTVVWNLSQNVDRTIGSSKPGICPCLTPSMIPYITNRGGPMVGLEALSMQGLPVDKLLLTRETEDQLADLAGNAMSTTVVGACILAALVSARKLLKKGDDHRSYESKAGISKADHESMDVDVPSQEQQVIPIEDRICGEEALVEQPLDLSATGSRTLADLLKDADKSARLCFCEGRVGQTTRQLSRCSDCQTSFCRRCGGRPEHNPSPISPERLAPSEFARELKGTLPMAVVLEGVSRELLDRLKKELKLDIPEKRWDKWVSAVVRASEHELRFVEPKRQEIWTAVYSSPVATLELVLHPQQPEWYLYAKAEDDEPADSEIRKILDHAVGRLRCDGHLFNGEWQFALPSTSTFPIKITGTGPLVPSWEARLGLQEEKFKNREVFSQLRIEVPPDDVSCLERNISGTYTLLDKCGTANGGLHRREPTPEDGNQPTVFMLLDPHRTNDAEDSFVFSISMRRYEYGETRPIICKLDSKWRQSSDEGTKQVKCHLPFYWATSKKATLKPAELQGARFAVPSGPLNIPVDADGCQTAIALLVCRVPVGAEAGPEWPRGTWREVDKINERSIFRALSWLMERICHNDESFVSWQSVDAEKLLACERCAPSPPKNRLDDPQKQVGTVKVGLNVPTLLHRALSRLPNLTPLDEFTLSWRLDTNFTPAVTLDFPKFTLKSNKPDSKHAQPPSFKLKLRPEQLRSLTWMVAQESKNAPPFIEEEIAEAILDPLGWRAEGRAQRSRHIRGGVLADQVGYGKTAITLGLIDTMAKDVMKEFSKIDTMDGKIPTKATLVVVPPHLTRQWGSEVKKFTGKRFNVQIISTVSNLNSLTIKDIEDADIVIVASNLFKSNVYLENLQELACVAELPSRDGRHFNAGFERCLESLRNQVNTLRDQGSSAVIENMKDAKRRAAEEAAEQLKALQSKRLKGKHYREAAEAAEAERKSKTTPTKAAKKVAVKPAKAKASKVVESDSDAPYIQDTVEVVIPIQNSLKGQTKNPTDLVNAYGAKLRQLLLSLILKATQILISRKQ